MEIDLKHVIVVGDRVLIKPKKEEEQTVGGLYLPPGYQQKENVLSGWIIKVGPGYPIPMPRETDEPWKPQNDEPQYIPLQTKEGDFVIFLQKGAIEIMIENEKYYIVPQANVLLIHRVEY